MTARIEKALGIATALYVKGSMVDNGSTVSFDLHLNKNGSSEGTVGSAGTTMTLIVVGGVTYVQLTAGMESVVKSQMASSGDAAERVLVADLSVGKWISSKSAIGRSMTSGMSDLTSFDSLVKLIESQQPGTFTYLRTSTCSGQPVAQYKDVSRDSGIPALTMDVPLYGSPLPVKEDGGSQGSLDFTWNQPTKVRPSAAADILDLPAS